MCGRYLFTQEDDFGEFGDALAALSGFAGGEVFPSQAAPVLRGTVAGLEAALLGWGFPPQYGRGGLLINARGETAAEKRSFRESFEKRRCVVPASGYFEWKQLAGGKKEKYLFTVPGARFLCLAGLWAPFEEGERFVILTTEANETARPVHPRMPVLVPQGEALRWTADEGFAHRLLQSEMPEVCGVRAQ